MTFLDYLTHRRRSRSVAWHFVLEAKRDPDFPDVGSWEELEAYLSQLNACGAAVAGARATWRSFVRRNRPQSRRRAPEEVIARDCDLTST